MIDSYINEKTKIRSLERFLTAGELGCLVCNAYSVPRSVAKLRCQILEKWVKIIKVKVYQNEKM